MIYFPIAEQIQTLESQHDGLSDRVVKDFWEFGKCRLIRKHLRFDDAAVQSNFFATKSIDEKEECPKKQKVDWAADGTRTFNQINVGRFKERVEGRVK